MKLLFSLLFSTIIVLPLYTQIAVAQISAKIYEKADDYHAKIYTNELIVSEQHSDSILTLADYIDFDIYSIENTRNPLKKRCWAVEYNDSLFINCRMIKYKWFVPAIYKNDKIIYFRAFMSRLKENEVQMHIAGKRAIDRNLRSAMGGTENDALLYMGGAGAYVTAESIKAANMASQLYNYIIDIPTGKIKVVDIPLMQEILQDHPDLDRQYMNEGHPEDAASILSYLKAVYEK